MCEYINGTIIQENPTIGKCIMIDCLFLYK